MKALCFTLAMCLITLTSFAQPNVQFVQVASGFNRPVDIVNAGDSRFFIMEQDGIIRILDSAFNTLPTPFLNIDPRVRSIANEQGLLGLVFHPDYINNGYFYVNYTDNNGDTKISRFSRNSTNPDLGDPGSEQVLMTVSQPFANHNAGDLVFGPDGYLYFGLGDGGSGGDPQNNAQDPQELLGKMIRIDVNSGSPYAIPATNPFVNDTSVLDEIFALGVRNPWRISFDRLNGDLWIADVGQNDWEEVDIVPLGSNGGQNFGWRCYEGNNAYNTSGCQAQTFYDAPVFEYDHNTGSSITGGFVYRGQEFPELKGHYILADWVSGFVTTIFKDTIGQFQNTDQSVTLGGISTFGEDANGEIYAARLNGRIYRVIEECEKLRPNLSIWNYIITANFDSLLPPGTSYQWLLNGNPLPGDTNLTLQVNQEGNYSMLISGDSCVVESATLFVSSVSSGISSADTSNWNETYGWGDHNTAGYLTEEVDPQVGIINNNVVPKWNDSTLVGGSIIDSAGQVGIGTNNLVNGYTLSVGGKIIAEEIQILPSTSWPDYVFENDYNLWPLNEVEKYIEQNKHLPGVPSTDCVEEEGISVGEMNAILLKKIEELTLHILQQNKRIESLEQTVYGIK